MFKSKKINKMLLLSMAVVAVSFAVDAAQSAEATSPTPVSMDWWKGDEYKTHLTRKFTNTLT